MRLQVVGPPAEALTVTELDGCANIYNPATCRAVLLNETATAVWQLSDGTHDVEAIVVILADRYGMAPQAIRNDVVSAVEQLEGESLFAANPDLTRAE